jgi:endo-1,4-beta-xylanase
MLLLALLLIAAGCSGDQEGGVTNGSETAGENHADEADGGVDPSPAVGTDAGDSGEEGQPVSAEGQPGSEAQPGEQEKVEPSVEHDLPSLKDVYADDFPIGAAIEPNQTTGLVAELLKKHVNLIVAENAMKPASIQPSEGRFNWTGADRIVQFARENGMQLRFHTLVWHNQVPNWFFLDASGKPMVDETDPEKREQNKRLLLQRLETHVKTVVERYKDDIKSWDVVNEVIEPADPDGMRNSLWYQIAGIDYIETAFRAAREAGGPDIRLYINDYSTDDPKKRDRLYELVKELLDRGVPIDGVGHQTHISVAWPPVEQIIESMRKFAELGLDNIVTELDMSLYAWNDRRDYGDDIPEEVLRKQAEKYRDLFEAFRENKDMLSEVTFWGISDNHTWLSSFPIVRTEAPLLFDKNFHAKPAFWGVVDPSKLE